MGDVVFLTKEQQDEFASGKLFSMIFGRNPKLKKDRPFILGYLSDIAKTSPDILENMKESGLTVGQIEAIFETGIAPSNDDYHEYPLHLLAIWLQIANFPEEKDSSKVERRLNPKVLTDVHGLAMTSIYLEVHHTIVRFAHVLDNAPFVPGKNHLDDLFFYYLSRSIQIIRTIRVLLNNDEESLILSLCRNLFECFVHIKFLNSRPALARWLILPAMIDHKRFSFATTKSGKLERKKVVNLKTGKIYQVHYNIREIFKLCEAQREEKLYDVWYPFLSSENHITAELMAEFYDGVKFKIHRESDTTLTMLNLGFALAILADEVSRYKNLNSVHKRDVSFGAKKICRALRKSINIIRPHIDGVDEDDRDLVEIFEYMHFLCDRVLKAKTRRKVKSKRSPIDRSKADV